MTEQQSFNPPGVLVRLRLNRQVHRRIESFLREHFADPRLTLPPIKIYTGRLVDGFARLFQFGAITIGRRIFVPRESLLRDKEGRVVMPGWLLAHEAVHVCQYRESGRFAFLRHYLQEYFCALWRSKKFGSAARLSAYLSISAEVAARRAEEAYHQWKSAK